MRSKSNEPGREEGITVIAINNRIPNLPYNRLYPGESKFKLSNEIRKNT